MLLEFDLGGAEWFVTAFAAREPNMIAVYRSGKSPHPVTGHRVSGLSEEMVIAEDKMFKRLGLGTNPIDIESARKQHMPEILKASWYPRTMSIRQAAKKMNHGLNYRLGYKTYALKNEIEEREAKRIVELYRTKAYPGLGVSTAGNPCWYDRIDKTIRDTRTLTNCFGRKCYFQGALDDSTFRDATAFIPQSTVFDATTKAMRSLVDDESPEFEPAELLVQGHDSLLTQYLSRDYTAMARFAIKLGLDYMSPTLDYGEPFKLSVGLKVGRRWGALEELVLTPDVDTLAGELARVDTERLTLSMAR